MRPVSSADCHAYDSYAALDSESANRFELWFFRLQKLQTLPKGHLLITQVNDLKLVLKVNLHVLSNNLHNKI